MGVLRNSHGISPLEILKDRNFVVPYLLRDDFIAPLAGGAMNGTYPEPGPGGARVVIDNGNFFSIQSGSLAIGGVNVASSDPSINWGSINRSAGMVISFAVNFKNTADAIYIGYGVAGGANGSLVRFYNDGVYYFDGGSATDKIFDISDGVDYKVVIALRAAGAYVFINDGDYYKLIWRDEINALASAQISIQNTSIKAGTLSHMHVTAPGFWLPSPILSDGFLTTNEPNAIDYGGISDGDYSLSGNGGAVRKVFFDGVGSYCNIYSTDINDRWDDGTRFSLISRLKAKDAGTWTDGTLRYAIRFYVDANNTIDLTRDTVNSQLESNCVAGGVATSIVDNVSGSVDWFTYGATYSDNANQHRSYIDGVESGGSPVANAGAMTGDLSAINTVIGAGSTAPASVWEGWIGDTITVYGFAATPAQMLTIHNYLDAGTLTEQILNDMFGAKNWSWWKMNEYFISDGQGHGEGIVGGIGDGGAGKLWEQTIGAFNIGASTLDCLFVLSSIAIAYTECHEPDIFAVAGLTRTGGNIGLCLRYIDDLNYIIAYHTGANAVLAEVIAGAPNLLINAVAAYGVGDLIKVYLCGNDARLYYDNDTIGTATVDSIFADATKHGVYSTSVGNVIEDLTIYAVGSDNEYRVLEEI